jgi:hypothetical protein
MSIDPFWAPAQFSEAILPRRVLSLTRTGFPVPILGMLSGSAVSGIMISVDCVLKELQ